MSSITEDISNLKLATGMKLPGTYLFGFGSSEMRNRSGKEDVTTILKFSIQTKLFFDCLSNQSFRHENVMAIFKRIEELSILPNSISLRPRN